MHGYLYDPDAPVGHEDNPNTNLFPLWSEIVQGPTYGWGWYSCPVGIRHWWRALRAGYHGPAKKYHYAWDLAALEGLKLRAWLRDRKMRGLPRVNIMCHSLGARVVIQALDTREDLGVENVLFLNGAETVSNAMSMLEKQPWPLFRSLVFKGDKVLDILGENFHPEKDGHVIGHCGVRERFLKPGANWMDIYPDTYTFQADNPDSIGDHKFTYLHPENHGFLRSVLGVS